MFSLERKGGDEDHDEKIDGETDKQYPGKRVESSVSSKENVPKAVGRSGNRFVAID